MLFKCRDFERFFFKVGRDIVGIKCFVYKNDKALVNVSFLLKVIVGDFVFVEGGELYN